MKKALTSSYGYKYESDYLSDWDLHRKYIQEDFDAYESMLIGQVYDSVSKSVNGSKITDSYAATLAMERAARTMGKLPEGVTEATAKADQGKAAFMDLLRMKWIYPNANSQHPLKVKFQMWDLYSEVYGYMPIFYDWNVSNTGYMGPDCWLWNPRNLVPQQGKTSLNDMDYVTALTWIGKKQLQNIMDNQEVDDVTNKPIDDGWNRKALQHLIELAENETTDSDTDKDTLIDRQRVTSGKKKGICIATRYESGPDGRWISFAPDHSCVQVRDVANPHKNGRIPFVIKYSQTLFDSFYGLGGFQRAKPLQFARDGLTNFYFASLKRNLSPGIIVNANGVVKHTLDVTSPNPVLMETLPNSIRPMPTNNAGLSTYQGAMSALTGSLLAQSGSQNASIPGSDALNPSQGKTPAAIGLYLGKEATRDGQNQDMLESAIEQLTDGFFSLVVNIGTEDIPVNLLSKDIEEIAKQPGLADVLGIFVDENGQALPTNYFSPNSTQTGGELRIDPTTLKGIEYRFSIDPGSTKKLNKQAQLQELQTYMDNLAKFQNQFKDDPRIDVNWAKINKAYSSLLSIPGAEEFVTVNEDAPNPQEAQMQMEQQKQKMSQQPTALPHESLNYKDAPEDIKRQIEGQAGLQPSQSVSPAATQQALQHSQIIGQDQQSANQPQEQTPSFVGGQMYKDPLISEAAKHLDTLNKGVSNGSQ